MINNRRKPKQLSNELRRHRTRFWGRNYVITPRLVHWKHGDGKQLIYFMPLNTRPNYYVIRVDSSLDLESDQFLDLVDATIYDAIEEEFGSYREEWDADNGRTYVRHNHFPALNDECGSCWGKL